MPCEIPLRHTDVCGRNTIKCGNVQGEYLCKPLHDLTLRLKRVAATMNEVYSFSREGWCLLIFTVDASSDLFRWETGEVTGQVLGIAQLHTQMQSRPSPRPSSSCWPRRQGCTVTHRFFCGWCRSNTWWSSHQGAGAGWEEGRKKVKSDAGRENKEEGVEKLGWTDGYLEVGTVGGKQEVHTSCF